MNTKPRIKVVFDTNILVRTTFQKRSPLSARIYEAIEQQECIVVTSPPILEEVRDVINRGYIIEYSHTTPEMRATYLNHLIELSILTPGTKQLHTSSRDKKDNMFLVCASEANAQYIVTSDRDLLTMKVYDGTTIIPPHEFVSLLETGNL